MRIVDHILAFSAAVENASTALGKGVIAMMVRVFGNLSAEVPIGENLKVLNGDEPDVWAHQFRILNPVDGDKRVVWNSNEFAEIRDAKELFDNLVKEGMVPYRCDPSGKQTSEVMDEFDPHAEEIIFAPIQAAVGG